MVSGSTKKGCHTASEMLYKLLLIAICSLIFGYYAFQGVVDFLSYRTISQQSRERQESQPMPQICLASPYLAHQRLQQLGITAKEYEDEGIWTSSHANYSVLDEYQVKRIISPELNDTLHNIKVRSRINDDSDRYKTEKFTSEDVLKGTEVGIAELDYRGYYAIFCFKFFPTSFPFGIEKVLLYMKQKSKVFIVSPGNFYTFERKRNQMIILPTHDYDYQVGLRSFYKQSVCSIF